MLLAKVGFLAILTLLIMVAGKSQTDSCTQAVHEQFCGQ